MPRLLHRRQLLQKAGLASAGALLGGREFAPRAALVRAARTVRQPAGELRYQLVAATPDEIWVAQNFLDITFGRLFPDINVTIEAAPAGRDQQMLADMASGAAPDVFDTWRDDVVKYADRGQVLDLTALVERDLSADDIADYFPWQWRDFVLPSGVRFGMPKYVNLMVVWCNLDLFEEAGLAPPDETWTHDTYADAARRLTRRDGEQTTTWGLYYPAFALDRFFYKVEAWGGHVVDPEDPTHAAFDSDEALAAAEWARALTFDDGANARRDLLFPGGGGGVADTINRFAAGQLAMVEDGFYPFSTAAGVGDRFRWGYAPIPLGPAGRRSLGTADGFAIWSGTKSPDAAWELAKFLSGPEYQLELTVLTGYLPNRFSILEEWETICTRLYPALAQANLGVATRAMADGYPANRRLFSRDGEAQALINPALERVFVAGDAPVTHLADVARQVTEALRRPAPS